MHASKPLYPTTTHKKCPSGNITRVSYIPNESLLPLKFSWASEGLYLLPQDKIFLNLGVCEGMWDFRKLLKWTAIPLDDNSYDRRGRGEGSKSSLLQLILGSELTQKWSDSLSVWKPVWYTGWHTGVLASATSVVVVLVINVILTIYAATEYKIENGIGTLYEGNCPKSRRMGLWLHLGINVLSTVLLSGSNYTQQCLTAPTRREIDAAHARRRWMDIGVPSLRNLLRIKLERTLLWVAIGLTSIPLHLVYVYITISARAPAN